MIGIFNPKNLSEPEDVPTLSVQGLVLIQILLLVSLGVGTFLLRQING